MSKIPPLYGLVLAGGASRRMQVDKATLHYAGQTQLQRAYQLLSSVCDKTFVSVRSDQVTDPTRAGMPQIVDTHTDLGPLAGIVAAQTQHPEVAWLVMACDLPFVTLPTIQYLIEHRDAATVATAFRSTHDDLPEPLCAIWEPGSAASVRAAVAEDKRCPRKLLINSSIRLLQQPQSNALDNINTPDELLQVLHALGADPLTIHVQYFAIFREQAGTRNESINSVANSPALLYSELQQRYGFKLAMNQLKVAINNEFSDWHTPLKSNDHVAFIPPVAGG